AIIVVTLLVRVIQIPLYRKQIVSQRRMQLLGPELKEIQKRFKGDRVKFQEATQAFYKERGVNPAQGCLPLILQFILLIPMYTVFSSGLQNYDPNGMLRVFGVQLISLKCDATAIINAAGHVRPCIDSTIHLLGLTVDLSQPSVIITIGIGISILAIISSLLQLFQSRMTLPRRDPGIPDDQNTKIQRQSMLFLPFISIFYGGFLPAGLFIYWIVSTLFSLVQQYLIIGWGGMFPLLGWDPAFARVHTPRFPVATPVADPSKRAAHSVLTQTDERAAKAATTIRPRERGGRQGRRGRRR
ncbi:MAG: YidC/Oxa1 family membrane protein insertase, partial [Candidatus Limnocylindrales bacterium]